MKLDIIPTALGLFHTGGPPNMLRFAQQGINPSIPAEQADDRSISSYCAETDLSEPRSALWGDHLIQSSRWMENRVSIRLDFTDGVRSESTTDIYRSMEVNESDRKARVKGALKVHH